MNKPTLIIFAVIFSMGLSGNASAMTKPNAMTMPNAERSVALEQCSAHKLKAVYRIKKTFNGQTIDTSLTLLRDGNTVAHVYPDTQITESWFLNPRNNKVKPTRYFDEHQRAIEYQPEESFTQFDERNWSRRYQLIAQQTLDSLDVEKSEGELCEARIHKKSDNGNLHLVWKNAVQLVESLSVILPNGLKEEWSLESVSFDMDYIESEFAKRETYFATDYADVGDDHTDQFLTTMVNLGFVEGGASGFYNVQGEALEGQHGHSH